MGVRLLPPAQVHEASTDLIKESDADIARAKVQRSCTSREDYVIESVPEFREVNLIMDAFMKDAHDIGWKITLRKSFPDALVYDGLWHGIKADILMLPTPKHLFLSICVP